MPERRVPPGVHAPLRPGEVARPRHEPVVAPRDGKSGSGVPLDRERPGACQVPFEASGGRVVRTVVPPPLPDEEARRPGRGVRYPEDEPRRPRFDVGQADPGPRVEDQKDLPLVRIRVASRQHDLDGLARPENSEAWS